MSRKENVEALAALVERLPEPRLALLRSWAHALLRTPMRRRPRGHSSDPLTAMLHIRRRSVEKGSAVFELSIHPDLLNPNGVLAGPAVYAMVDYSMGAAAVSALEPDQYSSTIEIKISYLAAVRSGTLTARTQVIRQGSRVVFLESRITDESDRPIATATGSFIISRRRE